MNTKYLHLSTGDEPNIAVVGLTNGNPFLKEYTNELVEEILKDKLVIPLQEHFDIDVTIKSIEINSLTPIFGSVKVVFDDDENDDYKSNDTIYFNETWVY